MSLSDDELERYARHIVLRELGGPGQNRLKAARVLVVGAGGLGCPALQYLGAAGVGHLTIIDDDTVGLSNLQRQILFGTGDIGEPKAEVAAHALARLNPHVNTEALVRRFGEDEAELASGHDLILDGTDNFATRYAVNRAAVAAGVPLISAAMAQWEGQIGLYHPASGGPCWECVFPEAPAPGLVPSCAEAGVIGALPGIIGAMMAAEAIKHITGAGKTLAGRLLIHDALYGESRIVAVKRRADCKACGGRA